MKSSKATPKKATKKKERDLTLPDIPLSKNAVKLIEKLTPKIRLGLAHINSIPVAVLLWGPGMSSRSRLRPVRLNLRRKLRELGHAAFFSEELYDHKLPHSLRLQQLIQAQNFDLIVSLPATPGAIAEIHDFIIDKRVRAKLLIFLDRSHRKGYSHQSIKAINNSPICKIEYYSKDTETMYVEEETLRYVQSVRESKYLLAGGY